MQAVHPGNEPCPANDDGYEELLKQLRRRASDIVSGTATLFTTDVTGLFDLFLSHLPPERRQHYTCRACRRFIEGFGGLVSIEASGFTLPLLWGSGDLTPPLFASAVDAIRSAVAVARVTGVFVTPTATLGWPVTGGWTHMSIDLPDECVFRETPLQNAFQRSAERKEEYRMLSRALADFDLDTVRKAEGLLAAESLYRGDKTLGVAKWLRTLHESIAISGKHARRRENIIWRAVADAPPGFAHVTSTMIGTLLLDIVAGLPFDEIKLRFDAKMRPDQYRRPTAAPPEGQITQAEKVIASLNAAGSLARRYARLDEVQTLWKPAEVSTPSAPGGVFGHLRPRANTDLMGDANGGKVTWMRFVRTVLPNAVDIECLITHNKANYGAFVTAEDPNAPPILQWDREDRRNPASWYVHVGGSYPEQWNVSAGQPRRVLAISRNPARWFDDGDRFARFADGAMLILEGCRPPDPGGLALFPEILRSEFHGIAKTLEAFSMSRRISGAADATACGLIMQPQARSLMLRVTTREGLHFLYEIDRWD